MTAIEKEQETYTASNYYCRIACNRICIPHDLRGSDQCHGTGDHADGSKFYSHITSVSVGDFSAPSPDEQKCTAADAGSRLSDAFLAHR